MISQQQVNKPKKRSDLRKFLGKEYFILKRQINWWFGDSSFGKVDTKINYENSLIKHKSFLLRPLKDVEMYLQRNKVTNLRIAISNIDNVVIKPGQIFSIWQLVGRPTKSKGYLDGMTLNNGKITKDTGGGLCQLGNLLYWMALHTPLTIKERWRHGYDVFPDINRTIPFACGATLSYNYIDLQLENDTDKNFQINLWLDNEYLNGEITCDTDLKTKYDIYETDHMFKQQWWGGYTRHNKIWKKITSLADNYTSEELVTENNAIMMYSPLLDK
jgi:vancomycin resistance protein VanW